MVECAEIIADFSPAKKEQVTIQMDELDLRFGLKEIGELLRFVLEESYGLSNTEIADIKNPDA